MAWRCRRWPPSVAAIRLGAEPVLQMVTRDRNRIALQSDLLGAASLGIKNVLCLSGYHQTLTGCPESANVFDIDSTQFIELTTRMAEKGVLADGTKIDGQFSMLVGAVANPFLKPLELNLLRLSKKIEAGARFIQTHAVFDIEAFSQWLDAARQEGLTKKAAILASVLSAGQRGGSPKASRHLRRVLHPGRSHRTAESSGRRSAQKKKGWPSALKQSRSSRAWMACAEYIFFRAARKRSCPRSWPPPDCSHRERLCRKNITSRHSRFRRGGRASANMAWWTGAKTAPGVITASRRPAFTTATGRRRSTFAISSDVDALFFDCMGCFSCVQDCTKGLLCLSINPEYEKLGQQLLEARYHQNDLAPGGDGENPGLGRGLSRAVFRPRFRFDVDGYVGNRSPHPRRHSWTRIHQHVGRYRQKAAVSGVEREQSRCQSAAAGLDSDAADH